jgi:general secretion pathway protein I
VGRSAICRWRSSSQAQPGSTVLHISTQGGFAQGQFNAQAEDQRIVLDGVNLHDALSLGAGMKAAGALTDNAQRLGDVTAAHWCADNALVGIRLAKQFPDIGEAEFGCSQLGRELRGMLRSQTTPNPNFRRVDAVVADAQGNVLVTLSTVVGRY